MQDKLKAAIVELLKLCTSKGCRVKFAAEEEDKFGQFDPTRLEITVYKGRPDKLTSVHVFTLAHEYKHLLQYLELSSDQVDAWLYYIDATNKPSPEQTKISEQEADLFALQFCRDRKIKVPKSVKLLGSEVIFYDPK